MMLIAVSVQSLTAKDITDAARPGVNNVSIAVTNLWVNRMIADAALPEEGKFVEADWAIGERVGPDGRKTPIMARKITALPEWYKDDIAIR